MATQSADLDAVETFSPVPRWIASTIEIKEGRDPLGLQTTTQDRLMPVLIPGILEGSRRGRYFSFHAFLLDEYRQKQMRPDPKSLGLFIRRREWDLGLAIQRCPNHCGSGPVGARGLGSSAIGPGPFARGESVESPFGGYGLYYRSPMAAFGIVAKTGTLLGNDPIPIDVLYATERASSLVEGFRSAVRDTAYYRKWMWTEEDLPAAVVDEYAAVACLCRLRERGAERDAVHDALFGSDTTGVQSGIQPNGDKPTDPESNVTFSDEAVRQRRRSVAHYLTLVDAVPEVVNSDGGYREAIWSATKALNDAHSPVAGQWAALVAKDVWQEAICSVWSALCQAGLSHTRRLGRGLTWDETRQMAESLVDGAPRLNPDEPTSGLVSALAAGTLRLPSNGAPELKVSDASMEELRHQTAGLNTAPAGVILLLELARRAGERSGMGWEQACRAASSWQPSLAEVLAGLRSHLDRDPTVKETIWWLVSRFIIPVHERISYSKLHANPPEFTFRFRWEDGLLRFYDNGVGRFPLASIRHGSLASLTWDLGLWEIPSKGDRPAVLTGRGMAFVAETFK